jgi:hypothetical protein
MLGGLKAGKLGGYGPGGQLNAQTQRNFIAKRLQFFLCRRPCPVECAAYSTGVTGIEKDINSLRPQRLERAKRAGGEIYKNGPHRCLQMTKIMDFHLKPWGGIQ